MPSMIVSDTVAAISNSDAPAIAMVLQTSINMAQATAINTYMHALEVNGPAVDSATAATLYIAGKLKRKAGDCSDGAHISW